MFTGIIQATCQVVSLKRESHLSFAIEANEALLNNLNQGASIAIDGVCLTVVEFNHKTGLIYFDVVSETLSRTTLNHLRENQFVNVERALKLGDELGGHLLSGHIMGTATICEISETGKNKVLSFQCPEHFMKYLLVKGWVAIDGISLTISQVNLSAHQFSIALIPETNKRTTIGMKKKGSLVNIEIDLQTQGLVQTTENWLEQRYPLLNHPALSD